MTGTAECHLDSLLCSFNQNATTERWIRRFPPSTLAGYSRFRCSRCAARRADCVIITGILLPGRMDGVEFIAQLKADERTKSIPGGAAWNSAFA